MNNRNICQITKSRHKSVQVMARVIYCDVGNFVNLQIQ